MDIHNFRSVTFIVLIKILCSWLMVCFLIALISPLVAYAMGVGLPHIWAVMISLLIGTLATTLVGAIGAALTLTTGQGGMLVSLLALPLYIPVLIFGAGMLSDIPESILTFQDMLQTIAAPLYMLLAIAILSLCLVPLVISLTFRHTLES